MEEMDDEQEEVRGRLGLKDRPGIMAVAAFGSEDYSFGELVAELASAYLCARNGINNTLENSSAYIQSWLKVLRDDKTMLLKASSKAMAAVEYIFGMDALHD